MVRSPSLTFLALLFPLIGCGARSPLAAVGDDASADGDGSAAVSGDNGDDGAAQDAFSEGGAAADGDPCSGMPPMPCPAGGHSYCVNGQYTQCPKTCGICVPGSARVCFKSYCSNWGSETCAPDGLSFGPCKERGIPSVCGPVAEQYGMSSNLEQCCIDNGFCCDDHYDLNKDGNYDDSVGMCRGTTCN